jgi:hypothetical protein
MNHAAPSQPPRPAAAIWKQRYEALRQLAVGGIPILGTDPLALVLLVRHGVAGWMRHWSQLTAMPTAAPEPRPPTPVAPASELRQQLTQLLADMSLAHLPKGSP